MAQLQAGLTPQDIAGQLRGAGWTDELIATAFAAAREQLTPIATPASVQTTPDPTVSASHEQPAVTAQRLPEPIKRGRLKTGWLLFKQSLGVIKTNPGLSRYVVMSMVWSIGIFGVFVAILILDSLNGQLLSVKSVDANGSTSHYATLPGLLIGAVVAFLGTFVTYFYGTALSSHVLAIFRGTTSTYQQHIARAKTRIVAIATYALIATVVGYLLRLLEERFRIVGWIIARILGALWTLATSFVLPIIADSEESGPQSIKHSVGLFKKTWGETIVSRVSLTGLITIVYIFVGIPVTIVLAILLGMLIGPFGVLVALIIYVLGVIVLMTLSSLASNILNVSLYYYAQYGVIPPSFSPELLAGVFIPKKSKTKR